ncbi:MAG TPA: ankyrin repeat domain-containing protein [Pyrinomonadaceae bacterium]|nr:ankyrin repeat domain-containing protein [Pyrinomonadaceae bacterium]
MSASSTGLQNQPHENMLVQAAEAGDFGAVEAFIVAGMDVNSANEHGTTALMAAAANGHLALVSFLLQSGADLKAKRHDGFDALALAVFYGRLGTVRELIGRGADPKANDRLGTSPEMWATVRGFHDIAQVLTDAQTIDSAETVAHQSELSSTPSPELISAQEPVVKEAFFSDQELSDETLSQEATVLPNVITQPPKALGVENQPSSVEGTYVPKPRYYLKRKSPNSVESSVESTYVPKPRYHHHRKSRKLVRWLAYITSDWQRLTVVTLIVMLICGLGTIAVLHLLGLSEVSRADKSAIITQTPATDDSHSNTQNDPQSITRAQPIPPTRATSDASAERSILVEKKSNDRGGPKGGLQVNNTEKPSRLRDVKPLPKSSDGVVGLHRKGAITSKQEPKPGSRPAQSFRSSRVSAKSIQSTNEVAAGREDPSDAKAPPHTFRKPPSIKTQRPRRVAGRNDRLERAVTSGRSTKPKVIQWP